MRTHSEETARTFLASVHMHDTSQCSEHGGSFDIDCTHAAALNEAGESSKASVVMCSVGETVFLANAEAQATARAVTYFGDRRLTNNDATGLGT